MRTLKKCFDRFGKLIIRENYVGEFFMKNGLLYEKHQETKTGRSSNQLVVPMGLQILVKSVNHGSSFSGHLEATKTEFRGQNYARTSLDSAIPVMCAKEQLRRVMSRKYRLTRVYAIDRYAIQEGSSPE